MGDELEFIEALDDLSNAIKSEITELSSGKFASKNHIPIQNGLILSDLDNYNEDAAAADPNGGMRHLLSAWQTLVEALFTQRTFLQYTPGLVQCVSSSFSLKSPAPEDLQTAKEMIRDMRCFANLMIETVENHAAHDSTELRFATLLEILLSLDPDWTPSDTINALWQLVGRRVESDCDNEVFRKEAYKVLVSLPWSPTSCALYSACSYKEAESILPEAPLHVLTKLSNMTTLLRSDKVYDILEKLDALEKDEDQETFTIAISSAQDDVYNSTNTATSMYNGQGMGKTTLAALIAAHPTIAQNYSIFWADLDTQQYESPMSYEQYATCLESLCHQLGVKPNWPNRILRLEDESVRIKRESEFIEVAKAGMTKLFERSGLKILVVVDGVNDDKDFDLFQFLDTQSSIVVSKSSYTPEADIAIEMEEMSADEAITLFAKEASRDRNDIVFYTNECKSVMQQCLHNPLIIRTAAHWFRLKQVTSGLIKGLTELNLELSMLRHSTTGKSDAFKVLAELMNLMLSPNKRDTTEPTILLKLCLSSVAVVFGDKRVPLDAVLALWTNLLTSHPESMEEIADELEESADLTKHIWFIVESFILLGLLSTSETKGVVFVKLHHQLYVTYGLSLVPELQDDDAEIVDTIAKWHNNFVMGYQERVKLLIMENLEERIQPYALEKLVTHMIEAKSIPQVLERLKDEKFCRGRLKTFGWFKGARIHVEDCLLLRQRAKESKSASAVEIRKVILSCLKRIASILSEETPNLTNDQRVEKAMALHLIGFTQADHHGIGEALTQYKNAMHLMPTPGHPFNAVIMYSQAVLHLIRNDHDKALKKIKGCSKVLKDNEGKDGVPDLQPELLQLRGDALAAACDYLGAETCFEESLKLIEEQSPIEMGNALYRRARIHQIMGELNQALSALAECINWKHNISENSSKYLAAAYSVAADIYLDVDENDNALKHYERALSVTEDLEDEADEIDILILNGKIESLKSEEKGGKEHFETARKLTKKSPRLFMDQSAYDLRCIGKIYADRGEKKEASQIFEEGIDLTQDRPESLERACILYELANCMLDLGNNKEAVTCFEETLKIRKAKLGECELVLDTQIEVGKVYRKLEMHQEGLTAAKDVMFLTEKIYKGIDSKAASALFGVAEAYEILGNYQESVAMFEECKELLKKAFRVDQAAVAKVLQRMAKLHANHKNIDKAFTCYSEALDICKKTLGPEHPQLGETLYGTGTIARKKGDLEFARDCLQESLKVYKELELSRETCLALIELGNVYRMANDPDTAAMCYERCLTFLDAEEEGEEDEVSDLLNLAYGHAKLNKMQLEDALECYDSALATRTEKLGKDHVSTAIAARSVGVVKYLLKSFAEARIYLGDFVRVMDAKRTFDSIDYAIAFLLFGEMSHAESRFEEARHSWGKARDTIKRNPKISEAIPELEELVSERLETKAVQQEQKSFFSRFTELARFEDEVSGQLPIEERIEEAIRNYNFEDD